MADDESEESGKEYAFRKARGYLTTLATMVILMGVFCIAVPFLPVYSAEQADENPWVWIPVGIALIVLGSLWLRQRIRRDGFHPGNVYGGPFD